MAITSIKETFSGFTSTSELDVRRAARKFTVAVDSANDNAESVRLAVGIRPGDPLIKDGVFDPFRVATRVDAKPRPNNPFLYDVTIPYATQSSNGQDDRGVHPLDRPPQVRGGDQVTSEAIDTDANGRPITTANGEGFDPPIQAPVADFRLVIAINEPDVNFNRDRQFSNRVNSREIFGSPPGTVKMAPIQSDSRIEQFGDERVAYWRRTYRLDFRDPPDERPEDQAWHRRVLHHGFLVRIDGINDNEPFDLGQPGESIVRKIKKAKEDGDIAPSVPTQITSPIRLDETGFVIPPDAPGEQSVWLNFQIYKTADLNAWGLEAAVSGLD